MYKILTNNIYTVINICMQETPTTQPTPLNVMEKTNKSNNKFLFIGIFCLILFGVSGYLLLKDKLGPTIPMYLGAESSRQKSPYKNGSYSVVGNYSSPAGVEEIAVTLTLTDGVITDSNVDPKATKPISLRMQNDFAANYKRYVLGKDIDSLKLDKVSGSSLTPLGFNDALDKIKKQAAQ